MYLLCFVTVKILVIMSYTIVYMYMCILLSMVHLVIVIMFYMIKKLIESNIGEELVSNDMCVHVHIIQTDK